MGVDLRHHGRLELLASYQDVIKKARQLLVFNNP